MDAVCDPVPSVDDDDVEEASDIDSEVELPLLEEVAAKDSTEKMSESDVAMLLESLESVVSSESLVSSDSSWRQAITRANVLVAESANARASASCEVASRLSNCRALALMRAVGRVDCPESIVSVDTFGRCFG